jgi:hypothetical protein
VRRGLLGWQGDALGANGSGHGWKGGRIRQIRAGDGEISGNAPHVALVHRGIVVCRQPAILSLKDASYRRHISIDDWGMPVPKFTETWCFVRKRGSFCLGRGSPRPCIEHSHDEVTPSVAPHSTLTDARGGWGAGAMLRGTRPQGKPEFADIGPAAGSLGPESASKGIKLSGQPPVLAYVIGVLVCNRTENFLYQCRD